MNELSLKYSALNRWYWIKSSTKFIGLLSEDMFIDFSIHRHWLMILAIVLFPLLCCPIITFTLFSCNTTSFIGPTFRIVILLIVMLSIYSYYNGVKLLL